MVKEGGGEGRAAEGGDSGRKGAGQSGAPRRCRGLRAQQGEARSQRDFGEEKPYAQPRANCPAYPWPWPCLSAVSSQSLALMPPPSGRGASSGSRNLLHRALDPGAWQSLRLAPRDSGPRFMPSLPLSDLPRPFWASISSTEEWGVEPRSGLESCVREPKGGYGTPPCFSQSGPTMTRLRPGVTDRYDFV